MKLLLAWVVLITTLALVVDQAQGQFGIIGDNVCTATSIPAINRCGQTFAEELHDVEVVHMKVYLRLGYCCAFNHLRNCIVDNIADSCKDNNTIIDTLVTGFVNTAKHLSDPDGGCDVFKGTVGKVLCQQTWLLVVEGIALILLFLFACCCTIKMCCGSRKGRQHLTPSEQLNMVKLIAVHKY